MPPAKKKQKKTGIVGVAASMTDVSAAQRAAAGLLDGMYKRRKPMGELPAEPMAEPIGHGGTFSDITARFFSGAMAIDMGASLLQAVGIMDADIGQAVDRAAEFTATVCMLKEWPVKAGAFTTTVYHWGFHTSAFWKDVHMSEVVPIARSILLTKFKEDSPVTAKLPPDPAAYNGSQAGSLHVASGGVRVQAAQVAWICLCMAQGAGENFDHPGTVALVRSLLEIPTHFQARFRRRRIRPLPGPGPFPGLERELLREELSLEPLFVLDWSMPLTTRGHEMLFGRIFADYSRDTALVEMSAKKQYRKGDDALLVLRKVVGMYDQVKDFLQANMRAEDFEAFNQDVHQTDRRDQELIEVFENFPRTFSVSQLTSQQEAAMAKHARKTSEVIGLVEESALKLRAAQWEHFENGIRKDWELIEHARGACTIVADMAHRKKVRHLQQLSATATKHIEAWTTTNLRLKKIGSLSEVIKPVTDLQGLVAAKYGIGTDDIFTCLLLDFNVPGMSANSVKQQALNVCAKLNDFAPRRTCALLLMPDRPKASSKRGISDEEYAIEKELWALKQHCDTRFVVPFELTARASRRCAMRRFTEGRLVFNGEEIDDNVWAQSSELSVMGRPVRTPVATVPQQNELLIPESTAADEDLLVNRDGGTARPSEEQVHGQKGPAFWGIVLESLCADVPLENKAICVVNLTGYVEDVAAAVLEMRFAGETGSTRLHYLSVHTGEKCFQYGKARADAILMDEWMKGRLVFEGVNPAQSPPGLTDEEIAHIPGGTVALGRLEHLQLECCTRAGDLINIHPDQVRAWTSAKDGYTTKFKDISETHETKYQRALVAVLKSGKEATPEDDGAHANDGEPGAPNGEPEAEELDSTDSLLNGSAGVVDYHGPTMIDGVKAIIVAKDDCKQLWFVSTTDLQVGSRVLVGGYGGGKYNTATDSPGQPFVIESDQDLVEYADESGKITCETFYQMIRGLENRGVVDYNVSHAEVSRDPAAEMQNKDCLTIKMTSDVMYQYITESADGKTLKLTSTNIFRILDVGSSPFLARVFRFRYEKVGKNLKPMKPYVRTKKALTLSEGKPLRVA